MIAQGGQKRMLNFSKPENARYINRLKVVNALRTKSGLSRAQLAKEININKVSMGEIVQDLVDEGVITEGVKQESAKGRPGTSLSLNESHAAAIGVDISTRVITITLFSLLGTPIRMERYPSSDFTCDTDYFDTINAAVEKFTSFSTSPVIGMCIALNANISPQGKITSSFLPLLDDNSHFISLFSGYPFPVILAPALICAAEAERFYFESTLENMLFINWGEHLSSALILRDRIIPSMNFAHMPMLKRNVCHCGSVGCLETIASGYGLRLESEREFGVSMTGREMIKQGDKCRAILMRAAEALAKALVFSLCSTGANAALIGGGLSNLPDEYFAYMLDVFSKSAAVPYKDFPIYRSYYKEKGTVQGAGLTALEEFFYRKNLLLKLNDAV